ncbi:hypothetical protein ACFQVA_17575 [Actinomadura keratinilytica]
MIRFEQVSKVYADGTTAVDDLTLEVAAGNSSRSSGPRGAARPPR